MGKAAVTTRNAHQPMSPDWAPAFAGVEQGDVSAEDAHRSDAFIRTIGCVGT